MRGQLRGQLRGDAFDLVGLPSGSSASQQLSSHYWLTDTGPDPALLPIIGVMNSWPSDRRPSSPLQINTEVGGVLPANQRKLSVEAVPRSDLSVLTPARCDSPVPRTRCDGWCGYDLIPRANVVSGHSVLS